MTTVSLRLDDEMKKQLGIAASIEPFYSTSNMEQLQKADQQIKNGQTVTKTMEELEALAGE